MGINNPDMKLFQDSIDQLDLVNKIGNEYPWEVLWIWNSLMINILITFWEVDQAEIFFSTSPYKYQMNLLSKNIFFYIITNTRALFNTGITWNFSIK